MNYDSKSEQNTAAIEACSKRPVSASAIASESRKRRSEVEIALYNASEAARKVWKSRRAPRGRLKILLYYKLAHAVDFVEVEMLRVKSLGGSKWDTLPPLSRSCAGEQAFKNTVTMAEMLHYALSEAHSLASAFRKRPTRDQLFHYHCLLSDAGYELVRGIDHLGYAAKARSRKGQVKHPPMGSHAFKRALMTDAVA